MSINPKCPKCGSCKVQLSNSESKHGCLWLFLFGIWYVLWVIIKWCIGLALIGGRQYCKGLSENATCGNVKVGFPTEKEFFIAIIADIILKIDLRRNF